jgi:hypothetical protein
LFPLPFTGLYTQSETELFLPPSETLSRTFGAATIIFRGGTTIQQIQLISEFSAIQFSGLPLTAREPEVQAVLAGYGFTVELDTICLKVVGYASVVTNMTVQDPHFTEKAVREIQKELVLDKNSNLKVCTKTISGENSAVSNRFEARSVSCS